jgi:hypothetical protein
MIAVCLAAASVTLAAQRGAAPAGAQKAPAKTPAKAPAAAKTAPAPAPALPQVSVAGVRIIGPGFGANGSEIHAFNNSPGTTIAIAFQAAPGTGIIDIDDRASRIEGFADDKGQNLLAEGRLGSFPKISEDHSVALVELEVQGRPSTGAAVISARGTVAMTLATGSNVTHIANLSLEAGKTFKIGAATVTVKSATPSDDNMDVTLGLPRSLMNAIKAMHFADAKGQPIDSHQTSSGYTNEVASIELELKTKDKAASVDFDIWQSPQQVKVPFNLAAGLGMAADATAVTTTAAVTAAAAPVPPKPVPPAPAGPPKIAPGPNDGAASIDAVVSQLQTAGRAGKGRDLLAVIYPDDRVNYAMEIATLLAFSTLAHMDDEKALDKAQKDVDALFAKLKVKTPLNDPDASFKNTDLAAFVTESLAYLKASLKNDPSAVPVPSGKPQDVQMSGDSAMAKLDNRDETFARVNNKWFIRVALPKIAK